MRPERHVPGPGEESVWDYPRPPRLEDSSRLVQVEFNGEVIAQTRRAKRVLETSHPPVYYLPPEAVRLGVLEPHGARSWCEWKGEAQYYDVVVGAKRAAKAAWGYPHPSEPFRALARHVAFYPRAMDGCFVDGERVEPQPGGFYGGWITADIVGPFKGEPGTMFW